jgi:hypothetical protein
MRFLAACRLTLAQVDNVLRKTLDLVSGQIYFSGVRPNPDADPVEGLASFQDVIAGYRDRIRDASHIHGNAIVPAAVDDLIVFNSAPVWRVGAAATNLLEYDSDFATSPNFISAYHVIGILLPQANTVPPAVRNNVVLHQPMPGTPAKIKADVVVFQSIVPDGGSLRAGAGMNPKSNIVTAIAAFNRYVVASLSADPVSAGLPRDHLLNSNSIAFVQPDAAQDIPPIMGERLLICLVAIQGYISDPDVGNFVHVEQRK